MTARSTAMRLRVVAPAALALAALLGLTGRAGASETWCDVDPPVVIQTPDGNLQIVYVEIAGPLAHVAQLLAPAISYQVKPSAGDGTKVDMTVTVADVDGHQHEVQSEVWTGPGGTGTLLASDTGRTGSPMPLSFKLGIP